MSLEEALSLAKDKNLDLLQVSPLGADPVVCKILDYGKHLFSKKKVIHRQNVNQGKQR